MDALASELDDVADAMRASRPAGPTATSLEQRLAIAAILAASGAHGAPSQVGRFEVQSRIGGGAMGVVYRAWDPELERLVAIKVLRGLSGADERERVASEARALARVSHPHVVAVHDILAEDDELCVVMEYAPGVTLRAWLDAHPYAPWREVLGWFVQTGRGVAAAHAAGVVHQDLKPDNVLVGDDGRARVIDFGLARRAHEGDGVIGGTPRYMAPEVARGVAATAQSDQFSFCVALEDALASRAVPEELRAAVARGRSPDPAARHAGFTPLLAILERALETRSTDRARDDLLERVERLWLKGVLDRSLGDATAVSLTLARAPELVDAPQATWRIAPAEDTKDAVDAVDAVVTAHALRRALDESHGALLVVGPPGSGKTTLLLGLCRELLHTAHAQPDEPAPVVLSLSTYEPDASAAADGGDVAQLSRWVTDELVTKYGLPRSAARRWLDDGGLVLLLDGLDETDAQKRAAIVRTLNRFRADRGAPIVVTCRDSEYEALDAKLAFGGALRVLPLGDAEQASYLEERHLPALHQRLHEDTALRAHLRNPLLLHLVAHDRAHDRAHDPAHEGAHDRAHTGGAAPLMSSAWERYVVEQLARAPAEAPRIATQLQFLARAMRAHNTSDLWLERLHFGWLPGREGTIAYAIGVIAVLVFGVGLNLVQVPITKNPLPSALIFGVGVSVSSFAYTRGRMRCVERLRFSWRRMVRLLPVTTLCASLIGLAEALRVHFVANLVGAGITGALLAVTFALEAGDRASKVRPNAGMRRSLAFALGTSFGFGVPAGLLFGFVIEPFVRIPLMDPAYRIDGTELMAGVSVGLFVFTALFLIYGGFTVIMHSVLRVWLALRTPLPLDLERMLDRAVELGLLRRVGGGFVFLHRTLLDHFADRPADRAAGA